MIEHQRAIQQLASAATQLLAAYDYSDQAYPGQLPPGPAACLLFEALEKCVSAYEATKPEHLFTTLDHRLARIEAVLAERANL